MAWSIDVPTGTYQDHTLSSQIRRSALARTIFTRFVRPERGYGKNKGQSVTVTRVGQLSPATRLTEADNVPINRPAISTIPVVVTEWGQGIEVTEFEENLTHFNVRNVYQQTLRDNMRLTLDVGAAEAYKSTPYKFIPTAGGGVFDTDGTPSTSADANLTVAMLKTIKDRMAGTLKIPPFSNGRYVGILCTRNARGIKNDAAAATWLAPTSSSAFMHGTVGASTNISTGIIPVAEFIGTIENIDLYESNNTDALADLAGGSSTSGESVFFGDDAVVLAQVMAPELRAELPTDFGRKRAVGWVGTLEFKLIWDTAAETRAIHVTSS